MLWHQSIGRLIILISSAGHLNEHIQANPSHRQYYSHKLSRLVGTNFGSLLPKSFFREGKDAVPAMTCGIVDRVQFE